MIITSTELLKVPFLLYALFDFHSILLLFFRVLNAFSTLHYILRIVHYCYFCGSQLILPRFSTLFSTRFALLLPQQFALLSSAVLNTHLLRRLLFFLLCYLCYIRRRFPTLFSTWLHRRFLCGVPRFSTLFFIVCKTVFSVVCFK